MSAVRSRFPGALKLLLPFAALALASCGNSCFIAYSNNGNGGVIVKGGDPPPTCGLNQTQGMVRVTAERVAPCENCNSSAKVEHLIVSLRGIQLQAVPDAADPQPDHWIDLAPLFVAHPRQFDFVGDSSGSLAENVSFPAGPYRALRLQFSSDSGDALEPSLCGPTIHNCAVLADGQIVPLAPEYSELLLPAAEDGAALLVLPGSTTEIRIQLGALGLGWSPAASLPQMRLTGAFQVIRNPSPE